MKILNLENNDKLLINNVIMLNLFQKTMQKGVRVAVFGTDDRISMARIIRNKDSSPVLNFCKVQESRNLALRDAELKGLASVKGIERQTCSTLVPFGQYQLIIVDSPNVSEEEMKAAVRWKIKDLIDFNIDEAVIDVFPIPDQKSGDKVYVVVARKQNVETHCKQLTDAGFALDTVDIPEMAMRNVATLVPEDIAGVAMLYLDAQRGLITISRQSSLYLSRHIDTGFEEIEVLFGNEDKERIQEYADKIVVELQRSLDYYESNFNLAAISNVLIAPTPSVIPEIDQYIQNQLGVNCRYLDMNTLIDMEQVMDQETQWASFMSIGSALRTEEAA